MVEFKPVVFYVGGQKYGIDINYVQGIEKEQVVCPVPNAPEHFNGIINLRGIVVPVYSLRKKFNIDLEKNSNPQYIIAFLNDTYIALEVDGVEEIHTTFQDNIHGVPDIIQNGETRYIQSVINDKEGLILIIDIKKLLSEEEQEQFGNMVKNQ